MFATQSAKPVRVFSSFNEELAGKISKRVNFAAMDIHEFLNSGIIEKYCLGFCTEEEKQVVENYVLESELVRKEIDQVRLSFENHLLSGEIKPSPAVKLNVMRRIYEQQAEEDHSFPPLFSEGMPVEKIISWVRQHDLQIPAAGDDNLSISVLPSTSQVTNLLVTAKLGHDNEIHHDFDEYLFVIKGSCTMDFESEKRSYGEHDLIYIKPGINHSAMVTSVGPMVALVQRQMCI